MWLLQDATDFVRRSSLVGSGFWLRVSSFELRETPD